MSTPTYSLPVSGTAPNQVASKAAHDAEINRVITGLNATLRADIDPRAVPIYPSRASAVSGTGALLAASALPAQVTRILVQNGTALEIRARSSATTDPLYPSGDRWGVVQVQDVVAEAAKLAEAIRSGALIPLASIGGTGDAWTAELAPSIVTAGITSLNSGATVEYIPALPNAAANPTGTIAGTTFSIRDADGGTWPAFGFVVGRSYNLRRRGNQLRVQADVAQPDLAAARTDRITGDAQMGSVMLGGIGGTGDAITGAVPTTLTAIGIAAANIREILFTVLGTNTGTVHPTVNIDGQGPVQIRDYRDGQLPAAALVPGPVYRAVKVGSRWRLITSEVDRAALNAAISSEAGARAAAIGAARADLEGSLAAQAMDQQAALEAAEIRVTESVDQVRAIAERAQAGVVAERAERSSAQMQQDLRIFDLERDQFTLPASSLVLLVATEPVPVGWEVARTELIGSTTYNLITQLPFIPFTISGLSANRVYQRATTTGGLLGLGSADVAVSLSMPQAFGSLEYRLRDADSAAIVQNWTNCDLSGDAGTYPVTVSCPARTGRYLLDFRSNRANRNIVQGNVPFSVGAIILGMGQSQMDRTWKLQDGETSALADLGISVNPNGWCYTFSSRNWARPADGTAFDSPFAAVFMDMEIARRGVSVAYVGASQGSTTAEMWLPGTSLWNRLVTVMDEVKGFESFIWHIGGTDSANSTPAETYAANMNTIIDALAGLNSRGAAFSSCVTATATRKSGEWQGVMRIRRAAQAVAASRANTIYCEPRDVTLRDQVHQDTAGNIQLAHATARHFAALEQGQDVAGPVLVAAIAKFNQVFLTFAMPAGMQLVGLGDWKTRLSVYPQGVQPVVGTAGRLTVTDAAITGPNTVTLTLGGRSGRCGGRVPVQP